MLDLVVVDVSLSKCTLGLGDIEMLYVGGVRSSPRFTYICWISAAGEYVGGRLEIVASRGTGLNADHGAGASALKDGIVAQDVARYGSYCWST